MTICIESKKGITTNGYSRLRMGKKQLQAHRWVWELVNGAIPQGMVIDHLCSNKKCVALDHLRMVTQGENILAGKHSVDSKTHCKQNHSYPENLTIRKSGKRECAECNRVRARAAYARKKANA